MQRHSRGAVSLRVLHPEKALPVLLTHGAAAQDGSCFTLPALSDGQLAQLTEQLAASHAGIVALTRHTKSLEEIFFHITGEAGA